MKKGLIGSAIFCTLFSSGFANAQNTQFALKQNQYQEKPILEVLEKPEDEVQKFIAQPIEGIDSGLLIDTARIICSDCNIQGIFEGSVNNQLATGGEVVVQVSEDVLSYHGQYILIPKGSRMVCSYEVPALANNSTRLEFGCDRIYLADSAVQIYQLKAKSHTVAIPENNINTQSIFEIAQGTAATIKASSHWYIFKPQTGSLEQSEINKSFLNNLDSSALRVHSKSKTTLVDDVKKAQNFEAQRIIEDGALNKLQLSDVLENLRRHDETDENFARSLEFDPAEFRGFDEYWVHGFADLNLKPKIVFRDNIFTYIQWDDWSNTPLPVAFVLRNGIDSLVNSRVRGKTFIIESTADLISLKIGNRYLYLDRKEKA